MGGGGGESGSRWKITKVLCFLAIFNTGLDPLKQSHSYQASIQCWAIIGTPAKRPITWRFAGGPMMARDSGIWILSHQQLKHIVKIGPPLTQLSGSAHGCIERGRWSKFSIKWCISVSEDCFYLSFKRHFIWVFMVCQSYSDP